MANKVLIAGSCRTAVGKMGGTLSKVHPKDLASHVMKEALNRSKIDPKEVDMVYFGCVLQGALGQNVARQASVAAGMPVETPAMTINIVCGSGLESVNMGARLIASGDADVVVCGGVENMSYSPYAIPQARYGYRMGDGTIVDTMISDALTDAFNNYHMGITAENVAEKYNLTREELDDFSAKSQQKASKARSEGRFKDEIAPIEVKLKKETIIFDEDEGIREGTTAEGLSKLRPAFKKDGMVTAGNSSTINDGSAAIVLVSEEKAKSLGIEPKFQWVGGALGGVEPEIMGVGPIVACNNLMDKTGLKIEDFDLIEANEAFATQSIAVIKELGMDPDIVNVNGGAIAIGHPVGASGCRILVTLLYEMLKRENANTGLATLCIGGGMGCALAVKKVK